jgi:hypothetical protein
MIGEGNFSSIVKVKFLEAIEWYKAFEEANLDFVIYFEDTFKLI